METSAKEAENVERLFMEIAAELMEVSKRERTFYSRTNFDISDIMYPF